VVDAVAAPVDWLEIELMNRVIDGENVPIDDLDDRVAAVLAVVVVRRLTAPHDERVRRLALQRGAA
jgi:hypothetical protein